MNLGETLLVLGALVIFSMAALYLNDSKFDNDMTLMETEFRTTAIGIAQSFVEEAQSLKFDEILDDTTYTAGLPDNFTNIASLGPDAGESYLNFDDVDDFNGYSANINTPRANYDADIIVSYADSVNINPGYLNKSFLKIMTVKITSIFFSDSIKVDYLYSYR